jgi:hypothetical protein
VQAVIERRDCGTGAGGFKPGNKCGAGGGGGGGEASPQVKTWAEKKFADPEHAKAFTEWFGGSQVTDGDGQPRVVYHGTDSGFDEFDPGRIGSATDPGELGAAFYFSTDAKVVGDKKTAGMPVYLKAEIPLRLKAESFSVNKKGLVTAALGIDSGSSAAEITAAAIKAGFDSVVLDYSPIGYNHSEIAVFTPTQIKSATGNSGSFDPKNPKITRAMRAGNQSATTRDCGTGAGGFKPGNKCAGGGGASGSDEKTDKPLQDWRKREEETLSGLRTRLVQERDFADDEIAASNERRSNLSKQMNEAGKGHVEARAEYKNAKQALVEAAMQYADEALSARLQAMDPIRRELFLVNNKSSDDRVESLRQAAISTKEKSAFLADKMLKLQGRMDEESATARNWMQFQKEAGWAAIKEYSMATAAASNADGGYGYLKEFALEESQHFTAKLNSLSVQSSVSESDRALFEENSKKDAVKFLSTVMNPADPAARYLAERSELHVSASNGRAYSLRNEVHVSPHASVGTVIHELGHVYESNGKHVLESAVAFRAQRCSDSGDVKMAEVSSSFGYSDQEVGNPDDFEKVVSAVYRDASDPDSVHVTDDMIKSRAAYIGKAYRNESGKITATEIVTIGLEMLHRNPAAFAKADPEYFDFMVSVVSGKSRSLRQRRKS